MKIMKKLLSFMIMFALVFSSIGLNNVPSFATEYYEYPAASKITSVYTYQDYRLVNGSGTYFWKPIISLVVSWNNIGSYSFDNTNWYGTNKSVMTFNIMEDYYNKYTVSDANTIIPKSVNVIFLYVKEKNSAQVKVYQYKLGSTDLSFIYSPNSVPQNIINVTDTIDALPLLANLDTKNGTQVKAVNDAWNAFALLNEKDQSYVYNYWKLYGLKTKVDQDTVLNTNWNAVFPDLVDMSGKLTEQYYDVSKYGMYDPVFVNGNKDVIFGTPLGNIRYNNATSSVNVLNDTTSKSANVFFTYDVYGKNPIPANASPSMAKKVWGYFIPPASGQYNFRVKSDDGHVFRLYMTNGTQVQSDVFKNLNSTTDVSTKFDLHGITDYYPTGSYTLQGGVPYPLYVEYFNHGGDGALMLYYKATNTTTWTEMKGGVFKPSSATTFNTNPIITSDLKLKTDSAKKLLDDYLNKTFPTGGTAVDGYVPKASYDALLAVYNDSMTKLNNAPNYTQEIINQAVIAMQTAIDTFKKAVITKANLIGTFSMNQEGDYLHLRFDKDLSVLGYKIVLTNQDFDVSKKTEILAAGLATNGLTLNLTNAMASLGPNDTKVNFTFNNQPATLTKTDSKPDGVFDLKIAWSSLSSLTKVYAYAQTYNASVSGEFTKESDDVLKAPATFKYFTETTANTITFVAPEVVGAKYLVEYVDASNKLVQVRMPITGYTLTLNLSDINQAQFSQAKLAVLEADALNKDEAITGKSPWIVGPTKIEIPKVSGLNLKYANDTYKLEWTALDQAASYDVYYGDSDAVSSMVKLAENISGTSFTLATDANSMKYYSVKAKFATGTFKESAFSDAVHMELISAVGIKNYTAGTRELTPTKSSYFVLTGATSENGFYTVTVPSNVKVKGYTTDVKAGDATTAIKVSYPEKIGATDETFTVRTLPVTVTTTENTNTGMTTYKFVPDSPTLADYAWIKKDFIVELISDKWYSATAKVGTMTVNKKNVNTNLSLIGESAPKVVDLSLLPNEKEVVVTVKPMTPSGKELKIVDGAAQVTLGKQSLKYHFEFTKGDSYKPIFEFVFNESPYVELSTYNFTFVTGDIGTTGTQDKNVYYTVKRDPNDANKRIIKVYFNQNISYKDKFIDVSVNYEPEVKNIPSNAKLYNVLSKSYIDLKTYDISTYSNLSSLLKPGVTAPESGSPNPADYLLSGLSIETMIHYDDILNSGLTGDERLITESSNELKIKIIDKTPIKQSF